MLGPSPRARGAHPDLPWPARRAGTIPACAGSTVRSGTRTTRPRDHPRVRGEHKTVASLLAWLRGPSPRARGAPFGQEPERLDLGTIPACAGSTPALAAPAR